MSVTEATRDKQQLCPRCGARLHRQHRLILHRLISIVYPVRYYACTAECKWTGLLPSTNRVQRRKRQIRIAILFVVLVSGAGWAVWRYGANLPWAHRSSSGDGVEDDGSGPTE